MAKDKERSINPAQAQRKLDKQKAVKKGKAEVQARRNEKLGRRNPERLQRQIDELKSLESSGQQLKPQEKKVLEELERDVSAIRKARATLGEKAPSLGRERRQDTRNGNLNNNSGVLGKRRRTNHQQWNEDSGGSETDGSVRMIPMPKDTPPPIPRQFGRHHGSNANREPIGNPRIPGEHAPHMLPQKPEIPEAKAVYESAPAVRNLRQEAVKKFVPAAVRKKQDAIKGQGRLVEPEEMDILEREGYGERLLASGGGENSVQPQSFVVKDAPLSKADLKLAEEEARFERELKRVQIEEVNDEDL